MSTREDTMTHPISHIPVQQLLAFLDASPTAYHAAANASQFLAENGFALLDEGGEWHLETGHGYMVQRNQSSLLAFRTGTDRRPVGERGFRIVTAHTDSPAPKLKLRGANSLAGQLRIPVEIYGGLIHSSWLDRPLGVAGRVACKDLDGNGIAMKCIDLEFPVAVIPNPAIHLERNINHASEYNPQQHLAALFGRASVDAFLLKICQAARCDLQNLMDMDLFLYDACKATFCGLDNDLVSSPRLDNLTSCHAILNALRQAMPTDNIQVAFLADNEEVGSRSPQGAQSSFLRSTLERVALCLGAGPQDFYRLLAHSSLVSADSAHGQHPNYPEKHDGSYAPKLNEGVVIKSNASLNYSSNAETASRFRALCQTYHIPVQDFINRSDMPCGSTIGPMCASLLGIPGIDIGTPLLAMHSCRELGGTDDHLFLIQALTAFLNMP